MLYFLAGYGILMAAFYTYVLLTAEDEPTGEAAPLPTRRPAGALRITSRRRRVGLSRSHARRATIARSRQA